jgi:GTP cyclohydrolase I
MGLAFHSLWCKRASCGKVLTKTTALRNYVLPCTAPFGHSAECAALSTLSMSATKSAIGRAMSLEQHYTGILKSIGEDPSREGLRDTPARAAKAMDYLCQGYQQDLSQLVNDALFASSSREMVLVKNIELYSLCEHHLLPFIGKAHVAYLPNGKVLGLSKVARIVEMYARRLQIQENLSRQIAEAIQEVTDAAGVAVVVEAQHLCMMMRGVEKQNSSMVTSVMLGEFHKTPATRSEFLRLIR